jgi:hypothetical protein
LATALSAPSQTIILFAYISSELDSTLDISVRMRWKVVIIITTTIIINVITTNFFTTIFKYGSEPCLILLIFKHPFGLSL